MCSFLTERKVAGSIIACRSALYRSQGLAAIVLSAVGCYSGVVRRGEVRCRRLRADVHERYETIQSL